MRLPKFEYHAPKGLNEACQILGELKSDAKLIAGGTDLLVNLKKKLAAPANLVSLGMVEELIGMDGSNGAIKIGACLTAAELAESQVLKRHCAALYQGAALLGSPIIRSRATIGGNLANARPAADMPPGLMVCGASAHLQSASGERTVHVAGLFTGPGQTLLGDDEILTHLVIPKAGEGCGSAYQKLGVRKALEIALVSAAAFIQLDGDGVVKQARVALGAVAPTPILAKEAADALVGEKAGEKLFARAGDIAGSVCRPIDDFRGSAEYRCDMVKVMTKRALLAAWEQARN